MTATERYKRWIAGLSPERLAAHREKVKAAHRRRAAEDPDKQRDQRRTWRKKNPEKVTIQRRRVTLKLYGLTIEEFEARVAAQDDRCAICGQFTGKPVPDHDHTTGVLRELLCSKCNSMLGMADDDPERLRAAADYIEKHRGLR